LAPYSKLPFVFKVIPVTYVDSRHYVDEPFNNPRNSQILEEGIKDCSTASISVSDSHYMDLAGLYCFASYFNSADSVGRKSLTRKGRKFISKVNPQWWRDLVEEAKKNIGDKPDDFVVLYSSKCKEHFMMYNSTGKKGKLKQKCVLTNAFVNTPAPKNYPGVNVLKHCYQITFNANDVFNHYLCSRYFPYVEKSGWEGNYTDFIQAAYEMNIYTIWHEIALLKEETQMDNRDFAAKLYTEMKKLASEREIANEAVESSSEEEDESSDDEQESSDEVESSSEESPRRTRSNSSNATSPAKSTTIPKSTKKAVLPRQAKPVSPKIAEKQQANRSSPIIAKNQSSVAIVRTPKSATKTLSPAVVSDTPRKSKRIADLPIATSPMVPKKFKPNSCVIPLLILSVLRLFLYFIA